MRMNVLTVKTINDQTLHFPARSKEKDVNDLPEVNNVERIRAVLESEDPDAAFECEGLDGQQHRIPAEEISLYDVAEQEDTSDPEQ